MIDDLSSDDDTLMMNDDLSLVLLPNPACRRLRVDFGKNNAFWEIDLNVPAINKINWHSSDMELGTYPSTTDFFVRNNPFLKIDRKATENLETN